MTPEIAVLCEWHYWKWSAKSIFSACQNQDVRVNSEMSVSRSSIQYALLWVHHLQCASRFEKAETDNTWKEKKNTGSICVQSHSRRVVEQSAWMRKRSQCVKNEQSRISKHLELRQYSHSSTPGQSRLWWVDENLTFSVSGHFKSVLRDSVGQPSASFSNRVWFFFFFFGHHSARSSCDDSEKRENESWVTKSKEDTGGLKQRKLSPWPRCNLYTEVRSHNRRKH